VRTGLSSTITSLRRAHARARRQAVVASGLVVLAIHAIPLVLGNVFHGRDIALFDLGVVCAIKAQLAAGQSLLVSPYVGNGVPLLFTPETQLFSPVRWMTLWLPAEWAVSVGVVIYFALGASTMCALLLSFRVRPALASLFGIGAAFTGPVVDLMFHGMYLVGFVALPMAWLGARLASRRGLAPTGLIAVTGATALALLAGEPQTAAIAVVLVVVEAVSATRIDARRTRHLLPLFLAVSAGALVGLFPWWATLAELALTARSGTLDLDRALHWGIGFNERVATLIPGLTSTRHPSHHTLYNQLFGKLETWIQEPYLGAPLLALAALGVTDRRCRTAVVVCVVGGLFSLGHSTFVLPTLMKLIPLIAAFRFPAKYLVVTTLALVIVAALGSERMLARAKRGRTRVPAAAIFIVTFGVAATIALVSVVSFDASDPTAPIDPAVRAFLWERAFQVAAVGTCMLFFLGLRRLPRVGVAVVVLFDLVNAAFITIETGPPIADARSIADIVEPAVSARPVVVCMSRKASENAYALAEGRHWNEAVFARRWHVPELQACDAFSSAVPYSVMKTRMHALLSFLVGEGSTAAARALGCHVVVTDEATDDEGQRAIYQRAKGLVSPAAPLAPADRASSDLRILLVDDARVEIAVAENPHLEPVEVEVVNRLIDSPTSAAQIAIIDDPMGRLGQRTLPRGTAITSVRIEERDTDRAVIVVEGTGGAVVVWNRAFAVGWTATQGEREVPVVRASGVSVAVVIDDVSKGPVTLRYRMPRFALAVFSLIVGIGLALLPPFVRIRLAERQRARGSEMRPAGS